MKNILYAVRYLVMLGIATGIHGGAALVAGILRVRHRRGGVYDWAGRSWGTMLLRATGVTVDVVHRDRVPTAPVVYIANHVSFIDIWVLLRELPGSIRFVFKREMMFIPLFGQAMRAAGHISIDRNRQARAFAAYDAAAQSITNGGISAAVFAEGTRSRDGQLRPFKKGPFVLAISAGVPIVPLYLAGTYAALPSGSSSPRPGKVALLVGQPIPTTGLTYDDRNSLSATCHQAIVDLQSNYSSTFSMNEPT